MAGRSTPWRYVVPSIVVLAIAGMIVGAVADGDWVFGVGLAVTVTAFVSWQLIKRDRARRRRTAAMAIGNGYWRGRIAWDPDSPLWPTSRWPSQFVSVDVETDPTGMTVTPRGKSARLRGLGAVLLRWDEIAGARAGAAGHELPDGTLTVTPQTQVTIEVVGERVPEGLRPMTDEESAEDEMTPAERAESDQEDAEFAREEHGADYRFGTAPLHFYTDDAAGLLEFVTLWSRGRV